MDRVPEDLRGTLMVPVPEAEPLVGRWRIEHDPPARSGIPAHITCSFPFRPALLARRAGHGRSRGVLPRSATRDVRADALRGLCPGVLTLRVEPADRCVS